MRPTTGEASFAAEGFVHPREERVEVTVEVEPGPLEEPPAIGEQAQDLVDGPDVPPPLRRGTQPIEPQELIATIKSLATNLRA